ncbi:hypothetical protein NW768_000546 [Fusarium equiseti]|uniref:GAR domain-containing protein n=1 Tax=Fusarium equiseti TaxID=61235 RepID=A0ABQ8RT77_FUSEQ|nr:hypothetical protein NW768_000546 [Fusarium equiseti]
MSDTPTQVARHARHAHAPATSTSTSPPPKNRISDDILANLGPRNVVDALNTATGALRASLDKFSTTDREFTMRTALASHAIWVWLEELQSWPWPSGSGSSGFEIPGEEERKKKSMQLSVPEEGDDQWMGSLLARDVAKYDRRVADIQRDLSELGIEDIKTHIRMNHIDAMSRPGTPLSEFNAAAQLSRSSYNRMEDHTAVIMTIVMHALPVLNNLRRLLQTWDLRLCALRRVPTLLLALEDAEVALQSAFKAISLHTKDTPQKDDGSPQDSTLTRDTFDVMKKHIEQLIARPGRSLDYMLDCLEGLSDTLPGDWLDRMEAVESSYSDWVVVCEKKIRETERNTPTQPDPPQPTEPPRSPSPVKQDAEAKEPASLDDNLISDEPDSDDDTPINASTGVVPIPLLLPPKIIRSDSSEDINTSMEPTKSRIPSGLSEADTIVPGWHKRDSSSESEPESPPSFLPIEEVDETCEENDTFDGNRDVLPGTPKAPRQSIEEDFNSSTMFTRTPETPEYNYSFSHDYEREISPELPPLRPLPLPRPRIDPSRTLAVRSSSMNFGALSSDPPEISGSPDLPRTRIREAEYIQASPPSSPPEESKGTLSAPLGSPFLAPDRNVDDLDISTMHMEQIDESYNDEFDDSFSISEYPTPFEHRGSAGDQHLQQQISHIIDSIPAKIKLTTEPKVNLNPPDLQLPRVRKRPSIEPFRRSTSGLSSNSRAGTPSFTLSPAKNTRVRNRGHSEIKVYHLSRSTGEAPIKLFIRCVGEQGERVMVRVGGGWADLGEYLKEYASHHKRRSAATNAKVEVLPESPGSRRSNVGSSPGGRPQSAVETSPISPLSVRKTRRSIGAMGSEMPKMSFGTPGDEGTPEVFGRSRSNSHLSWKEDDSSFLGLAGPTGKKVEMSEENKAWVASVKEKVRIASNGERRISSSTSQFGELGKVGGTKRLFLKSEDRRESKGGRDSRGGRESRGSVR